MFKKVVSILLVTTLCILLCGCSKAQKNIVKCSNCGAEIEIPTKKASLITGALSENSDVLCEECSSSQLTQNYISSFLD